MFFLHISKKNVQFFTANGKKTIIRTKGKEKLHDKEK